MKSNPSRAKSTCRSVTEIPKEIAGWRTMNSAVSALTSKGAIATGKLMRSVRSEEHTSELQSLMRISYAVFCLKKKKKKNEKNYTNEQLLIKSNKENAT